MKNIKIRKFISGAAAAALCLALLAGLFAVSAAADEEAVTAGKAVSEEDFIAAVAPQAFAVTMAAWLGDTGEGVSLSDPAYLWDAAGWYAAWRWRSRAEQTPMGRMLQLALNNRILGEAASADG